MPCTVNGIDEPCYQFFCFFCNRSRAGLATLEFRTFQSSGNCHSYPHFSPYNGVYWHLHNMCSNVKVAARPRRRCVLQLSYRSNNVLILKAVVGTPSLPSDSPVTCLTWFQKHGFSQNLKLMPSCEIHVFTKFKTFRVLRP
jgi:hypothetical protein